MIKSNTPTPLHRDSIVNIIGRKVGYFVSIIVTLVMIVVVRAVPDWNLSFINDAKFEDWIPFFVLSSVMTILANVLLLGLDPYRLRHLLEIFTNIFSLIGVLAFISIYPLRIKDDTLDTVLHIVLWLGVLGICISFMTDGIKVLVGQRDKPAKGKEKMKVKNDQEAPL